jgi:Cu/Ag efflux protein CusF
MTRRIGLFLLLALAGCGANNQTAQEKSGADLSKTCDMHGVVKAFDPATKTATIDAGRIGDWMEAMTMEYAVKPDAEFEKLHVGDTIDAKVIVSGGLDYYVTDVTVVPK